MQIIEKLTWICLGIISGFEGKISIVQYNYNCARDFYRQPFGLTIDFSFEYLVLCFENLLMFVVSDGCELWAVMNPVHLFHVSNRSMFKLPDEWVSALGHSDIGEYYEGKILSVSDEGATVATDKLETLKIQLLSCCKDDWKPQAVVHNINLSYQGIKYLRNFNKLQLNSVLLEGLNLQCKITQ